MLVVGNVRVVDRQTGWAQSARRGRACRVASWADMSHFDGGHRQARSWLPFLAGAARGYLTISVRATEGGDQSNEEHCGGDDHHDDLRGGAHALVRTVGTACWC